GCRVCRLDRRFVEGHGLSHRPPPRHARGAPPARRGGARFEEGTREREDVLPTYVVRVSATPSARGGYLGGVSATGGYTLSTTFEQSPVIVRAMDSDAALTFPASKRRVLHRSALEVPNI